MAQTSQSVHCMRCQTVRSLACFVGIKVCQAPAALNFAADTGWDTDQTWAPEWWRIMSDAKTMSFLVVGSDYNS